MKYEVVLLDMDGTILVNDDYPSSWPRIHHYFGVSEKAKVQYNAFMGGHYGSLSECYNLWMEMDANLWLGKGVRKDGLPKASEVLASIINDIGWAPGVQEFVSEVKSAGLRVGLISSGLDIIVNHVADELGIDRTLCFSNGYELDEEGFIKYPAKALINVPYNDKATIVRSISKRLSIPLNKFVGVDDAIHGYTLPKVCKDSGGLGVAFAYKGKQIHPKLKESVNLVISDFRELTPHIL